MNVLLSKHQQNKMNDINLQFKRVQNLTEHNIRMFHLMIEFYNS